MPAIIEVKYYNTFLLKKTVTETAQNTDRWNGSFGVPENVDGYKGCNITSSDVDNTNSWYIEEARIRGGYNNTSVDFGVKAYLVEDEPNQSNRFNSLIYSGIYNSRTGINNTNEFSVGEEITKSADPANGSIQKLYAEDTNLIIFQENKVSRALIDKDAIYSAEGGGAVTSSQLVIGVIQPYAGNFGISENPESFAVYGYRKYFTDKNRNAVMRLSQDGLTEISNYGMIDWFRDRFGSLDSDIYGAGKMRGAWDIYNKQYVVSLQQSLRADDGTVNTATNDANNIGPVSYTLSFDENVLGWPSFYSYIPDQAFSIKSNYYSIKDSKLYKHYNASGSRNKFYETASAPTGEIFKSKITFVFNPKVSMSKVFKTVNYEGSNNWEVTSFDGQRSQFQVDTIEPIAAATTQSQYINDFGHYIYAGFTRKEGKYVANLVNTSPATQGEIVWGSDMTGVKGYYATVTIESADNYSDTVLELFAVSSDYVESAY